MQMLQALRAHLQVATGRLSRHLLSGSPQGVTGFSLLGRALRKGSASRRLGLGGAGRAAAVAAVAGGSGVGAAMAEGLSMSMHTVAALAPHSFKEMGIFGWLLVDLALNWVGWGAAALLQTEKFYDAVGSLSFISLTAGSLLAGGASGARKFVVSGMVGLWAARLGSYLVARIVKSGKDERFDEVKKQPLQFWVYWTMQAVWVWVTLLPVLVVNGSRSPLPLGALDAVGIAVYALGLGIEAVADQQKWAFRNNPDNKGKFIEEGLWAYSRHPNYFGEIVIWCGVFLTCARSFTSPLQYATVASPLFVAYVLTRLSGVPMLEAQADKRYGHMPEYQQYKASTPVLVPLPRFKDTHTS